MVVASTLPQKNFSLEPHLKYVFGLEYACFGEYIGSDFFVRSIKLLYKMRFTVKRIINQNLTTNRCFFSANIVSYQDGKEIPHISNVNLDGTFLHIYKDAEYEGYGYWQQLKNGQEKFVIIKHSEIMTCDEAATFKYLQFMFRNKGCGEAKIRQIIKEFSFEAIDAIRKEDPKFATIIKSVQKRDELKKILDDSADLEDGFNYLIENEISHYVAIKVIKQYGSATISKVSKNPYCLLNFPFVSFIVVDKIAKKEGLDALCANRLKAGVMLFINENMKQNGDVYINLDELLGDDDSKESPLSFYLNKFGYYKCTILNKDVSDILSEMCLEASIVIEDNINDSSKKCLYRSYFNYAENCIVDSLKNMSKAPSSRYIVSSTIDKWIKKQEALGKKFDAKQIKAIHNALQSKISILTGGPGTGKTQTTQAIVDILKNVYPDISIALCAPTGKASRRMQEVIGMDAFTVHKLLNYLPFNSFGAEDLTNIDVDYLFIDETSMIDIDLMYRILSNIEEHVNIVFVGDYNQIPSVGPGLILRDMINSGVLTVTNLTTVFRQGSFSGIVEVSKLILSGDVNGILKEPLRRDFKYIEEDSNDKILEDIVKKIKDSFDRGILNIRNFQVITPMNDGLLGTLGLNKHIQAVLNPKDPLKSEIYISPTKIFRSGDKIIQNVNNYDLEVFNGMIGIIEAIDIKGKTVYIDFDGEEVEYSFEDMNQISLAYAITIHKSQGSEFDYVIMPLSGNHNHVNNRNLLYTALTRARKQMLLTGPRNVLRDVIKKETQFKRKSQILLKLQR